MFEGILANYPKRIDIWNVYVDQVSSVPITTCEVLHITSNIRLGSICNQACNACVWCGVASVSYLGLPAAAQTICA